MTKSQRIEKEITKTKEQLATIQAKLKKHDKEVQNVWCHSIKADREITE